MTNVQAKHREIPQSLRKGSMGPRWVDLVPAPSDLLRKFDVSSDKAEWQKSAVGLLHASIVNWDFTDARGRPREVSPTALEVTIGYRPDLVKWLVEQIRELEKQETTEPVRDYLSEMRGTLARTEGRKPGLGEAACHLVRHLNFSNAQARQHLQELLFPGTPGVKPARTLHEYEISGFASDGQKRLNRGYTCRFCDFP